MIILEGPDGAGKTTLLANLLDQFPGIEQHERASSSTGGPVPDVHLWAQADVETWAVQPLAFYDRHPLVSEPIYAQILRPGSMNSWFKELPAHMLMDRMATEALVVFCLPSWETVLENVKNEGQLEGVVDNLDLLYSTYRNQMFSMASLPTIFHYDYEVDTDLDDLYTMVEAHQTRWNRKQNGRTA